jgi:transcriptional regulator with XRE-family HTH domain
MNITLKNMLKKLRRERNLKQKEVAEMLNISQQTYGNYEAGNREPSITTLIEIAKFYKVSLDVLVGRYEENNIKNITNEVKYNRNSSVNIYN